MSKTDTTEGDLVLLEIRGGVATILLNDPKRRNPLSMEMKEQFLNALDAIESAEVRCIVVEGAEDAFCAGGDIDQMKQKLENHQREVGLQRESHIKSNKIVSTLVNTPVPVITKIDGPAAGGGAGIALAGDIKLASERAKIGFTFRNVGLSIDDGTSYFLPRITGLDIAKELVFTGRVLNADEAYELGLVNHVYSDSEFESKCNAIIAEIAEGPTKAFGLMKKLLNRSSSRDIDEALEQELIAQSIAVQTDDHLEGVRAFLDKREAEFDG